MKLVVDVVVLVTTKAESIILIVTGNDFVDTSHRIIYRGDNSMIHPINHRRITMFINYKSHHIQHYTSKPQWLENIDYET